MPYQHLEPLSKQVTIVVGLTVVGFMAFGLALSFYRSVLFEQTLATLDNHNNNLRQKILEDAALLDYYRSSQYKDKYAKENLGLVNPGEKVLIITQTREQTVVSDPDDVAIASQQQEAAFIELLRQMPVIEHWKMYVFHRDQVEEMMRMYRR